MVDIESKLEILGASLVATVPEAGSFISDVITLFWPENDERSDYLGDVTKVVYKAIQECLDKEKVEKLRSLLEGTREICKEYINTALEEEERKERFLSLHEVFTQLKPHFLDMSFESVVYFVQFAVLDISINVEIVLLFKSGHVALDEKNKQNMKDLIDDYSLYAHKMSIKLVEFRLSQIGTVCTCRLDPRNPLVVRVRN